MLYIGWVILNFGMLCLFLFYCLVAGKVIRQTMGVGPLLLILFGLIGLGSGPAPPTTAKKEPMVVLTGPAEHLFVPVADFYLASIQLSTTYQHGRIYHNDVLPTGFWFGCRWQTTSVRTELAGPRLRYAVTGVLVWKLLGLELYREHKELAGTVALRQ
jgi:hypothetical protein